MNNQTKLQIAGLITALAEYYDKGLTESQLAMYVEDLADLSPADLGRICQQYRRDPRNDRFPLPAKLRALVEPENPEDDGLLMAGKIYAALSRFGHMETEKAHAHLGDTAWEVVELNGGWLALCGSNIADKGTIMAQLRETARALIRRTKSNDLVRLLGPQNSLNKTRGLTPIGSMFGNLLGGVNTQHGPQLEAPERIKSHRPR